MSISFLQASRIGLLVVCVMLGFLFGTAGFAQDSGADDPEGAFRNLVKNGDYNSADFYIDNKFVDPEKIDVSQIFFDIFMDPYSKDLTANAGKIDGLYKYLSKIGKIDLNKTMRCGNPGSQQYCLLVNNLFTGANRQAVQYFVDRGLDLNKREPGFIPATVPLIARLGTIYSIEDLNFFVSKGMVLGDERYTIEELSNYREPNYYMSSLNLPDNYTTLDDQNFLDVLVIALGTRISGDEPHNSDHQKTLCDFITYAAPSFTPSFDYLLYLLKAQQNFRLANVGKSVKYGNRVYQPFPTSCVNLIRTMTMSHAKLQNVISEFARNGDVRTAQWLISVKSGTN